MGQTMTKILITGATGFVGSALVNDLIKSDVFPLINENNVRLVLPVRQHSKTLDKALINKNGQSAVIIEQVELGNFDENTDFSHALQNVDVVVHCAAIATALNSDTLGLNYNTVNVQVTKRLAEQSISAGVKQFVFLSSVKVLGEQTEIAQPFTNHDPMNPKDAYGFSKRDAELVLAEYKELMKVLVIRPTMIYGPNGKGSFNSLVKLALKGLPLPFGSLNQNKRSLLYVHNLTEFIGHVINQQLAGTFLVSDVEAISTHEMVSAIKEGTLSKSLILPFPSWLFNMLGRITNKQEITKRLTGNMTVDISDTLSRTGWKPRAKTKDSIIQFLRSSIS